MQGLPAQSCSPLSFLWTQCLAPKHFPVPRSFTGYGSRRGKSVFFLLWVVFCCVCAARFSCCGCALLHACPGPGVGRNPMGHGTPGRGGGFFSFCCGWAVSSLTHLLPAASEHPLQKDIQGPRRDFLLRMRQLTHSLAAGRPEHPQQKKHPQQNKLVPSPRPTLSFLCLYPESPIPLN